MIISLFQKRIIRPSVKNNVSIAFTHKALRSPSITQTVPSYGSERGFYSKKGRYLFCIYYMRRRRKKSNIEWRFCTWRGEVVYTMDGGEGEGRAAGSTVRQGGSSRQAAPLTDPPTILFLGMYPPPPISIRAAATHCCVWNNFTLSPKVFISEYKIIRINYESDRLDFVFLWLLISLSHYRVWIH